jgi:hypothetical protein
MMKNTKMLARKENGEKLFSLTVPSHTCDYCNTLVLCSVVDLLAIPVFGNTVGAVKTNGSGLILGFNVFNGASSSLQVALQPSLFLVLLSSQLSQSSNLPFPHTDSS